MKKYLGIYTTLSVLAVLLMPATLHAAPYEKIMEKQNNSLMLYVSETVNNSQSKKETSAKERRKTRQKLKEELDKLSPDERDARMKEIREERRRKVKETAGEPRKELSPEEKEMRKKARQARQAKRKTETVNISPEERKKQIKEQFKKRLETASPEEKSDLCKKTLLRCNKVEEKNKERENKRTLPICEIVKNSCSN